MARPGRYDGVEGFAPDMRGNVPFRGLLPRPVPTPEGIVEHVLREGDRLDALAHEYYDDSRLWHHILDANPQIECGTDVVDAGMVGLVIVIPPLPGRVG